jgi:hypothetical protein
MHSRANQRRVSGVQAIASALVGACLAYVLMACSEPTPLPTRPSPSVSASVRPTLPNGTTVTIPGVIPEPSDGTYFFSETEPPPSETGPGPPSATPSEGPARALRARQILDACVKGELTFRPPSPMRQGETREFVLHLSMGDPGTTHESLIPGNNPVETRKPVVCEEMRADLSGPGMEIVRTGNETGEMLVPVQGVAEWGWLITPKEAGRKTLTLRLFATNQDGPDLSLETFREDIDVEVALGYLLNSIVKDWAQPLGLTIPVLIGAIGAFLVWSRSRGRKSKHAANASPGDG